MKHSKVKEEEIASYRKPYRRSKRYLNYLKLHPDHIEYVDEQVLEVKCHKLFSRIDSENLD